MQAGEIDRWNPHQTQEHVQEAPSYPTLTTYHASYTSTTNSRHMLDGHQLGKVRRSGLPNLRRSSKICFNLLFPRGHHFFGTMISAFLTCGLLLGSSLSQITSNNLPSIYLDLPVNSLKGRFKPPPQWACPIIPSTNMDGADQGYFANLAREANFMVCTLCDPLEEPWKTDCKNGSIHLIQSQSCDYTVKLDNDCVATMRGYFTELLDEREKKSGITPAAPPVNVVSVVTIYLNSVERLDRQCHNHAWDLGRSDISPGYFALNGFSFSHIVDTPMSFLNIYAPEIIVLFSEPFPDCPPDEVVKMRVSLGGSPSLKGFEALRKSNSDTTCFSGGGQFVTICDYKAQRLVCPAGELLKSVEGKNAGDSLDISVEFHTTCASPENKRMVIPPVESFLIFYLKPQLWHYYPMESSRMAFPACLFKEEDSDFEFAGLWNFFTHSRVISESSWLSGPISEEACQRMSGTLIQKEEFESLYDCKSGDFCGRALRPNEDFTWDDPSAYPNRFPPSALIGHA